MFTSPNEIDPVQIARRAMGNLCIADFGLPIADSDFVGTRPAD
jgi:hypothetical protein